MCMSIIPVLSELILESLKTVVACISKRQMIFVSLIQTVGKSCGCRFVYNTFYFQTSNLSGFFCSLTLRVRGEQVARSATWAILRFLRSLASLICSPTISIFCSNFLGNLVPIVLFVIAQHII